VKKILVSLTKKEQAVAERVIADFAAGRDVRVVSVYSAMSMDRASLLQEITDTDGYLFGLESIDDALFRVAKQVLEQNRPLLGLRARSMSWHVDRDRRLPAAREEFSQVLSAQQLHSVPPFDRVRNQRCV